MDKKQINLRINKCYDQCVDIEDELRAIINLIDDKDIIIDLNCLRDSLSNHLDNIENTLKSKGI